MWTRALRRLRALIARASAVPYTANATSEPEDTPTHAVTDESLDSDDTIVRLEIEDSIDLHAFRPRDILDVVSDYLEEAAARGYSEVRLIHGRGKGVQRARVQALLREHPRVLEFADAPAARGGWGATVVWLRIDRT